VCHDEYDKENVSDFALWKAWSEDDGDVFWETEVGKGRPGWHIECSAMSMKYLGSTFDIHTGGVDLVFPHHENEIAQSEAATGREFVKYWLHCEHLIVDGHKMSKSEGNFFTLRDLLDKGMDPMAIRYTLLSTHFKQQLNFTFDAVKGSKNALSRIHDFMDGLADIEQHKKGKQSDEVTGLIKDAKNGFEENMDDNLNISGALASVFEFIKKVNILVGDELVSSKDATGIIRVMHEFDSVLGVIAQEKGEIDAEIEAMIGEREKARKNKDFDAADRIRNQLKKKGILLEDSKHGVRWKRA